MPSSKPTRATNPDSPVKAELGVYDVLTHTS